MKGRRKPDCTFGDVPRGPKGGRCHLKPGDYWKYVDAEGKPLSARAHCNSDDPTSPVHQNLTDTMWGYLAPDGSGKGTLAYHTVREHEDGTISIRPGDGSSNSVLHHGYIGDKSVTWHGYVDHGEWSPV